MSQIKEEANFKLEPKIIISVVAIILLIVFIIWLLEKNATEKTENVFLDIPEASMNIGAIGVLEEGQTVLSVNPEAAEDPIRPLDIKTPKDIFNTAGTILKIQQNSIVIRGNGSNFDDQVKRDLTIVINETTKVNGTKGDLVYFKESLNIGDRVLIEAPYNIHGKDLFLASYINTIKE